MNYPARFPMLNAIAKSNLRKALCLIGGAALVAPNVNAQDWPQWRGEHRDGKVSGFSAPATWPTNFTQQWKAPVGIGDSTPALVGDKLYTFGREETDEVVRCFDAGSGKVVWEQKYPADHVVTGPPSRHPGTRSSPVVADGKVCTLGVGGILTCMDASSGKVLWQKHSTNDYDGVAYNADSSMSPIVVDGVCVADIGGKAGGAIFAFDLATGAKKWKSEGDSPAFSSPVLLTLDGKRQLVFLTAKNVVGVGLADGKQLWSVPFAANMGNNTTPIVDGQTVIYTGNGKGITAVKIEAKDGGYAATQLWSNPHYGAQFTTPILKDGKLYGFNGHFFCVDAKTGADLWAETANWGNSASLLDAGDVILALTVKGQFVAFKPSDKGYEELAKVKVDDGETWAHPVVSGKRVFVRDRDSVALWTM